MLVFKVSLSSVCFSVKEYNECVKARSSNHKSIYHLGRCLESEEELGLVRSNLSHYYRCSLGDSSDEGVYVSHNSSCRPMEEVSNITELFDIPRHMRISCKHLTMSKKLAMQPFNVLGEFAEVSNYHSC